MRWVIVVMLVRVRVAMRPVAVVVVVRHCRHDDEHQDRKSESGSHKERTIVANRLFTA